MTYDPTELINSPYRVPDVKRGDWLHDEIHGLVCVGGYTKDRIIPWPRVKKNGRAQLILCGDLVRAVKTESATAVAHNWGVSVTTVWSWRVALGVDNKNNPGTQRLYKLLKPSKLTDSVAARGRESALSAESIEKMAATKRGKPMHPNTAKALINAAKKKKRWAQRQIERDKKIQADITRAMTADEEKIISRDAAKQCGKLLYYTGKPCEHGHYAERFVSSGACVLCNKIRGARYYERVTKPILAGEQPLTPKRDRSEPSPRKIAIMRGYYTYNTGLACKYGHVSARKTSSGECVECYRLRQIAKAAKQK